MKTTAVWSCAGFDTSPLSYHLGQAEAEKGRAMVVELPCLGIPRLGFTANAMDLDKTFETLMGHLQNNRALTWEMLHQDSETLGIAAASVYASPDHPLVSTLSTDYMVKVPDYLEQFALQEGVRHLIFECQGQMTHPMSFFAIRKSERVVIPITKATEAAFIIANVRRLVQIFDQPKDKFIILAQGDVKSIQKMATIKDAEEAWATIQVLPWKGKSFVLDVNENDAAPMQKSWRVSWMKPVEKNGALPAAASGSVHEASRIFQL